MPNSSCNTLALDESKYSSPMPLIGLYIAAGSSACFLAIFLDVLSAIRSKKRWIPCRFFSLNSVTLTLLGIAGKLPVDLTAAMPSTLDQFSKLTGMAFICISMGFLVPSLGMSQKSECISNLIALSILVVTVIVNICIQIHTGVILLFVTEHIIVMICMFGVLLISWDAYVNSHYSKIYSLDSNKDLVRKGEGSMVERLKLAYLYGFDSNPLFMLCKNEDFLEAGLSVICSVVVVQAAFRNLGLDFCRGKSDYSWSMWVIVVVQTLTILVGCLAICCRSLMTYSFQGKPTMNFKSGMYSTTSYIVMTPAARLSWKDRGGVALIQVLYIGFYLIYIPLIVTLQISLKIARFITAPFLKTKDKDDEETKDYKHLIRKHRNDKGLEEWVLVRGLREMNTWIDISRSSSTNHLVKLFSETDPYLPGPYGLTPSTFSLVMLAKIAQACIPPESSAHNLLQAYGEAREILHFIEDRMKSKSLENKGKSEFAKALWRGKSFAYACSDYMHTSETATPLWWAILKIEQIKKRHNVQEDLEDESYVREVEIVFFKRWREMVCVMNPLICGEYNSVEDLYMQIQQEFVYMLHSIFSQLPHAIYKEIGESSAENFHHSVRLCLGIACKLEQLQSHVRWSFPMESGISQLWKEISSTVPGLSQSEAHVVDISQASS